MPERPASAVVPLARAVDRGRQRAGGAGRAEQRRGSSGSISSIRTRRTGRRRRSTRSTPAGRTTARSRRPTRRSRRCSTICARPVAADAGRSSPAITAKALGDHGELSHGLFAYESTLRVPLIIAEVGGAAGDRLTASVAVRVRASKAARRGVVGRGAARRHPADDSRGGRPGAAGRSARAIAAAGGRARAPARRRGRRTSRRWARCSIAAGRR